MKVQDIVFIILLIILLYKHSPRLFVLAGLGCFFAAAPFFLFWIFFTAERLIWYGALLIFMAIIYNLYYLRKNNVTL